MTTPPLWRNPDQPIAARAEALLQELTLDEKLDQLNYRNPAIPRLGIPAYVWWNEALHGVARAGAATVFPQPIGLAATFSPDLVHAMGEVIAREGRARHHEAVRQGDYGTYKGLTYWSPNVNIFRDPRWGRGHETYGEDPFLTGRFGAAFVRGVQGEAPDHLKAVATPKHYAVHSGPEATRLSFDSVADERDLRETYLPAFKACFAAGAQSVMTAYNAYNGVPCAANRRLIEEILRSEWGFAGAVVTDAGCGDALYKEHRVVADYPEAVALEINNGVDVLVDWSEGAREAHARSLLDERDVNRAIRNQLTVKFRLGLFDPPASVPLADTPYEIIECAEHRALAQDATRRSLVLLKNEGDLLPLSREALSAIAVIGPNADSREVLLGNYYGTPTRTKTLLEGILDAVPDACRVWHAKGCEHIADRTEACAEDHDRIAEAVSAAERSDVALLCLGLSPTIEGEAGDAFNAEEGGDRRGIELPAIQDLLLERVLATGTPVVVLMLTGSAVVSPVIEAHVPALLQCWYPGAEGGAAIAEVLFGTAAPSGRLPVTFYKATADLPDFTDYAMAGRTYRFFAGEPAYPFGFGLSYTTFACRDLAVAAREDGLDLAVTVGNTGPRPGTEVIQAYVALEREGMRTPQRSLAALTRVELEPGEETRIKLRVEAEQLSLVGEDGQTCRLPGPCVVSVGGSQGDTRSIALGAAPPVTATVEI